MALCAAVCAMLLAAQAPAFAAQSDPISMLKQLPGLKAAYARKYIAEDRLPRITPGTPASSPYAGTVVTPTVLKFNSALSLSLAKRLFLNDETIRQMLGEPTGTITKGAAGNAGANAVIYRVRTDIGDGQAHALLIATRGNLGFLIRADGPDAALEPALVAFGRYMVNATPGPDREAVDKPHGSTGGLWDLFPTGSDPDVLRGLVPMYDYDLLGPSGESPIGSATPAS